MSGPNCRACRFSFMGPNDSLLVCGHPDAGPIGRYTQSIRNIGTGAAEIEGHCGPARPKFEQHPLRNPDGTLKSSS